MKLLGAVVLIIVGSAMLTFGFQWFHWLGRPDTLVLVVAKLIAIITPLLLFGVCMLMALNLYDSWRFDKALKVKLDEFDSLPIGVFNIEFDGKKIADEFIEHRKGKIRNRRLHEGGIIGEKIISQY